MLITGLCLAATALLAGLAGTWSPCGLSSVETLGSGLGRDARRGRTLVTVGAFTLAALLGGMVTFGAAGVLGSLTGLGGHAWPAVLAAVAALGAGIADLRFLPILPQIRHQVPEAVRWRVPLPVTAAAYGVLLGLGFTTYLLTYAMWALLGACALLGEPTLGVVVGAAFGLGRALPVVLLVPRHGAPDVERFIADMERGPALVGLRRITGVALVGTALTVIPVAVAGAAVAVRPGAADPSAAPGLLVYQDAAGGLLARDGAVPVRLPGRDPAAGGGRVAWREDSIVSVADAATLGVQQTLDVTGAEALAVSGQHLVYERKRAGGGAIVGVKDLAGDAPARIVFRTRLTAGAPSVDGGRIVLAVAGASGSRVVSVDAATGAAQVLREAGAGSQIAQAAVLGDRIVYVRASRCAQELRYGPVSGALTRDRVLLRVRSPFRRDGGYQPGYVDDYDAASKCPRVRYAAMAAARLWTVALGPGAAYVTRLPGTGNGTPALLRVPL